MITIKKPTIIGYSRINVPQEEGALIPDLATIFNGMGTPIENVIEYAGRVCYRSTANLGNAPDFIAARLREGHADIIEHGWMTIYASDLDELALYRRNRYLVADQLDNGAYIISGNFRAWIDTFSDNDEVMECGAHVAPQIFNRDTIPDYVFGRVVYPRRPVITIRDRTYASHARVALLASRIHLHPSMHYLPPGRLDLHRSATFMIDGLSRTASHQWVRHRLGGHSQESQRYVDLEKGAWQPIIPPAISEKLEAIEIMENFWQNAEEAYRKLREMGIRKEDARFLLPNAAETRIVTTMSIAGWRHFIEQRADKSAQWEIRAIAETIREMLREAEFG